METIILIAIVAAIAALIASPVVRPMFREWQIRRQGRAMMRARFPMMRELPLTRADKRGFETGRDGVICPRK